jgi:hypothetical protein
MSRNGWDRAASLYRGGFLIALIGTLVSKPGTRKLHYPADHQRAVNRHKHSTTLITPQKSAFRLLSGTSGSELTTGKPEMVANWID